MVIMDKIYEFMEDWEDSSKGEHYRDAQLLEAAYVYYENHPERRKMKDKNIISNYNSWKREKYYGE
jgi:hypothetical protein